MIRLDSVCGSSPALEKLTGVLCHTFPHCLGETDRRALPHLSAFRADQVENKFLCVRAIDHMFPNDLFHGVSLLLPVRFLKFTITTSGIQIHCMIMYFDGVFEKYIICLVCFAAFFCGFLWKIHTYRKMSCRFAGVLKNKKDREATPEEACCPCLFQGGEKQ